MLLDKQTFAPLQGNLPQFVAMYGDVSSQEFAASPNQALFFGNSGVVEGLLKPAPGNLTERLSKLSDASALADELYLAVFGRRPTAAEGGSVAAFLQDRQDRDVAIREMTWGLMSSNEFRFNH